MKLAPKPIAQEAVEVLVVDVADALVAVSAEAEAATAEAEIATNLFSRRRFQFCRGPSEAGTALKNWNRCRD